MKKRSISFFIIVTIFWILPVCSYGGNAIVRWQANTESDINGYKIYFGQSSRNYGQPITVDNVTQHIIQGLEEGQTYYIALTAVDSAGNESGYSSEVSKEVTASPPPSATTEVALWWTVSNRRSENVPVNIYNGDTLLDTVNVNQRVDGGQWNVLGSYVFDASPRIEIVSEGEGSTCADAVKITSSDGTESFIDNGADGTSFTGSWKTSSGVNPYGATSLYSYTTGGLYKFELPPSSPPPPPSAASEIALWWTVSNRRSENVPVNIYNGDNLLDTVNVNQRIDGGQWNVLGSYVFDASPRIEIVSEGEGSTCADAVKITSSDGTKSFIDNGADGTSFTGSWKTSSGVNPYGDTSLYINTTGAIYTFELPPSSPPPPSSTTEIALWWTVSSRRSENVPVNIYNDDTLLDTINVNQRIDGGQWNVLGSYVFDASPRIEIVSEGDGSTCADAVKITSSDGTESFIDNGADGTSYTGSWKISSGVNPYGATSLYSNTAGVIYTFK